MAMIVAGRFTTFDQANRVASRLYDRSFRQSDVSVFFLNPTGQHAKFPIGGDVDADAAARPAGRGAAQGVIAGGAFGLALGALLFVTIWRFWLVPLVSLMAGAYLGAFVGALRRLRGRERVSAEQAGMRDAGVMLATHVSESTADTAIAVLRDAGAAEIEQASGVWEDGEWRDFDPAQRAADDGIDTDEARPEPTIGVAANERSGFNDSDDRDGRATSEKPAEKLAEKSAEKSETRRDSRDATRARPRRTDWL